jgi:hypothetical protein
MGPACAARHCYRQPARQAASKQAPLQAQRAPPDWHSWRARTRRSRARSSVTDRPPRTHTQVRRAQNSRVARRGTSTLSIGTTTARWKILRTRLSLSVSSYELLACTRPNGKPHTSALMPWLRLQRRQYPPAARAPRRCTAARSADRRPRSTQTRHRAGRARTGPALMSSPTCLTTNSKQSSAMASEPCGLWAFAHARALTNCLCLVGLSLLDQPDVLDVRLPQLNVGAVQQALLEQALADLCARAASAGEQAPDGPARAQRAKVFGRHLLVDEVLPVPGLPARGKRVVAGGLRAPTAVGNTWRKRSNTPRARSTGSICKQHSEPAEPASGHRGRASPGHLR